MITTARTTWILIVLLSTLLCASWATLIEKPSQLAQSRNPPRLIVLVVFDQMRGDFLARWSSWYSSIGFNKLTSEGAWFTNCHYPYSMTVTGAGHATLGTGCTPAQHGIVENDWYDRSSGKTVYCATLGDRYRMVPEGSKSKTGKEGGGAPDRMLAPSLGELVKQTTKNQGKVIGISLKDRGALLPTGRKADICYWFDDNTGDFVTSNYYVDTLPAYMVKFNARKQANGWFNQDWVRIRKDISYDQLVGPDDVQGEGTGQKQGRIFPHPLTGGLATFGKEFYNAVYNSPMGNDLTWSAAQVVIDNEHLGKDAHTDYLVISYSSNDSVGHTWGPDSQEVLDTTLRSDVIMAEMIQFLDVKVGRENYILALSADHGICPLPEIARMQGHEARRVDPTKEVTHIEAHLTMKFGLFGRWIEGVSGAGLYLNYNTIKRAGKSRAEVESALAEWLLKQPYTLHVYTRSQMLSGAVLDRFGHMVKACFHPERSGDVMPVLKPYHFLSKYQTGTTHGSPHEYDTHVPLVVFGGGILHQKRDDLVSPQLAAVILAHTLGQAIPQSQVAVPEGLFK